MRSLLLPVLTLALGCKSEHAPAQRHVSALPALPAAPTATVDPPDSPFTPPAGAPAVVVWRGGGDPPKTVLSLRLWADGTIRFRCGRGGKLPPARVAALVDTFVKGGWGARTTSTVESDPTCITTSVQVTLGTNVDRRTSGCNTVPDDIADALELVTTVVGPDPCP